MPAGGCREKDRQPEDTVSDTGIAGHYVKRRKSRKNAEKS